MGDPDTRRTTTDADRRAWLALRRAAGLSDRQLIALSRRLGPATAIVDADQRSLRAAGLDEAACRAVRAADWSGADADLAWAETEDAQLLAWGDPCYPPLLAELADAPALLYLLGDPAALTEPQVAIVGSRNPTTDGARDAAAFARHLAGVGLTITSGLAEGIDAAAHRGALADGGRTVAVLGTGPDRCYPSQHRELADAIRAQGALVTEFPPGTDARREHFPQRNRLIAGLSVGTLVVEAAQRSGSLITARLAGEQGREVFALPGSIHNPLARGCHQLIRQGAKLVETADDLLVELAEQLLPLLAATTTSTASAEQGASTVTTTSTEEQDEDYRALLDALGHGAATMDQLVERSGLTADALSSMLLIMELDGRVRALAGGTYMRIAERSDA